MMRGDTIICGTSTTGTGTLTLAACPSPPGGIDLYQWLTAAGLNFTNGNAVLASYVLIEYSDATFAKAVNFEKGVGTVTLGASLGATTLARTTVQTTGGSLATTGVPTYSAPSAVSIGTAANTLVFIGPSAADVPAFSPYFDNTTSGNDNLGTGPANLSATAPGTQLSTLTDYYFLFEWRVPMVVKKCSMRVFTGYSGTSGTPISAAYARIYQINSSGKPGKLLVDFGAFAGTNPLNTSNTNISTTALSTGFLLLPGEYFFDFMPSFSGAGGTVTAPKMIASTPAYGIGRCGYLNFNPNDNMTASSGTAGAGPDPANLTGYAGQGGSFFATSFVLSPS